MCVPCKIIINEGAGHAAERLTSIREQLETIGSEISADVDDAMYEMACAEVALVEAARCAGVRLARQVGAAPRWVALMERL